MPYDVKYVKGDKRPYKIVNRDTGEVVGSSTNREDALRSINARNAGAHGAKLNKRKK